MPFYCIVEGTVPRVELEPEVTAKSRASTLQLACISGETQYYYECLIVDERLYYLPQARGKISSPRS